MSVYQEHGYEDREDYLESLADDYDVPFDVVYAIAEQLGESEDFDGLICSLQDAEAMVW